MGLGGGHVDGRLARCPRLEPRSEVRTYPSSRAVRIALSGAAAAHSRLRGEACGGVRCGSLIKKRSSPVALPLRPSRPAPSIRPQPAPLSARRIGRAPTGHAGRGGGRGFRQGSISSSLEETIHLDVALPPWAYRDPSCITYGRFIPTTLPARKATLNS
jgi:hypothetical protein